MLPLECSACCAYVVLAMLFQIGLEWICCVYGRRMQCSPPVVLDISIGRVCWSAYGVGIAFAFAIGSHLVYGISVRMGFGMCMGLGLV